VEVGVWHDEEVISRRGAGGVRTIYTNVDDANLVGVAFGAKPGAGA